MRPRRPTTVGAVVQARPTPEPGVGLIEISGVVHLEAKGEADDGSPARSRPFELGCPAGALHSGTELPHVAPRYETA